MENGPIIAATDGSESSLRAVEWAAREAVLRGTDLRVVSVAAMPPRMTWAKEIADRPETIADMIRDAAADALSSAAERAAQIGKGLTVRKALLTGPPGEALVGESAGPTMLVTGSRGMEGFTTLLVGSVSRYVATHARCPVVIAREEIVAAHREVAAGVRDLDDTAVLTFAFEEARLRNVRLRVIHAWQLFLPAMRLTGTERPGADADAVTVEQAGWLAGLLDVWRVEYSDVEVIEDAVHAHPGRVLAGASARADLVVIGRNDTRGHGTASTLHAVVSHATGPVAIIPE
jgi:nucleotide-binding universal stress UspA family protein